MAGCRDYQRLLVGDLPPVGDAIQSRVSQPWIVQMYLHRLFVVVVYDIVSFCCLLIKTVQQGDRDARGTDYVSKNPDRTQVFTHRHHF